MRAEQSERHRGIPDGAGGILAPIGIALGSFLVATGALLLVLQSPSPSIQAGTADQIAALVAELRAEREALSNRIAALEIDAPIITGSVDAPKPVRKVVEPTGPVGVELARGDTLKAMRERWSVLLGREPDLAGKEARIALEETATGQSLLLVAGPFADRAAALALCARLSELAPGCLPAPFEGQALPSSPVNGL